MRFLLTVWRRTGANCVRLQDTAWVIRNAFAMWLSWCVNLGGVYAHEIKLGARKPTQVYAHENWGNSSWV